MTTNDEILIIANQIANQGHKPTVALIKSRLKKKLPLPVIISILRSWQHDPSFVTFPVEDNNIDERTPSKSESNSSAFEHELQTELSSMKKEILELKLLVKELIEKHKN